MKKIIKVLSVFVTLTLLLTGCSSGYKDATSLLKDYIAGEHDNMTTVCNISLEIGSSFGDSTFSVPMEFDATMNTAGNYSHGNLDVSVTIFGQTSKSTTEEYTVIDGDSATIYSKSDDATQWSKSTSDDIGDADISSTLGDFKLSEDSFKDATLEHDKDAKNYIVTVKLSDIEANNEDMDFSSLFGDLGLNDDQAKKIEDLFSKITLTYVFDDETLDLLSATMDEVNTKSTAGDATSTSYIKMSMSCNYSDFGNIKEEDVKVPDDLDVQQLED